MPSHNANEFNSRRTPILAVSRKTIINITLIASLLLPSLAQASVDSCFNFLNAQDYTRAADEAQQALQAGNLSRIDERDAHLCLGRAYRNMGYTQDALPAYQRVEALSQTTKELAIAYSGLGVLYSSLGDLDRSEFHHQRALKAFRKLEDKQNEASTLNNLATISQARGDQSRALQLFGEALILQPEVAQATTLNNIAMIHFERKGYKHAIKLLREAIEIDRHNADAHAAAQKQINLGDILHSDRQYQAAEKDLLAGLNAIRLVGDKKWEADACYKLGSLAGTKGNPKRNGSEARQWYAKAEALYREIGDTANADEIAKLLAEK